jgi:hypothetical protein
MQGMEQPPVRFEPALRLPAPKPCAAKAMLASPIAQCMMSDRRPQWQEVDEVAARIWHDIGGAGGIPWRAIPAQSPIHRCMIAAARMALTGWPHESALWRERRLGGPALADSKLHQLACSEIPAASGLIAGAGAA